MGFAILMKGGLAPHPLDEIVRLDREEIAWCARHGDWPPGMTKMAIADALAAIWRRGNLVFEVDTDGPSAAAYIIGRFDKWPPSKPICVSILA